MIMQLLPPRGPHGVDNGSSGRQSDATGATATTSGCDARSGVHRTSRHSSRRSSGHSAGGQAAPGLERRQRARLRGRSLTFFFTSSTAIVPARMTVSRASAHITRVRARPARPTPDFVVVYAHIPVGRLNATLDGPAAARHPSDRFQCRGRGAQTPDAWLRGGADTAPDQSPAAPGGVDGIGQGQSAPSSQRGPCAPSPARAGSSPPPTGEPGSC